jgi:spore germination cell wall hydrolase CwlJ-like protein
MSFDKRTWRILKIATVLTAFVSVVVALKPADNLLQSPHSQREIAAAIDPAQLQCMAANIYHEARGESLAGRYAVAHVTMNRVKHNRFPDTVCDVVYQGEITVSWKGNPLPRRNRCQFSWYCDGRPDTIDAADPAWAESMRIAFRVMRGEQPDPTNGATHYYNHNVVSPAWRNAYALTTVIENHSFYRKGR